MDTSIYTYRLKMKTEGKYGEHCEVDFVNLTPTINDIVRKSNVHVGELIAQTKHTTAMLLLNEDEEGFQSDLEKYLDTFIPVNGHYSHNLFHSRNFPDGVPPNERKNGASHIRASLFSPSITLLIEQDMVLWGEWQSLFLIDLDAPNERDVLVRVKGYTMPCLSSYTATININ